MLSYDAIEKRVRDADRETAFLPEAKVKSPSPLAAFNDRMLYPTTLSAMQVVGYRKTNGVTMTINVTSPSTFTLNAAMPNGTRRSRFRQYHWFDQLTGTGDPVGSRQRRSRAFNRS